jgi:biotin synthase-related radical SAM superfamily protein
LAALELLVESGVDTVGIHIESFDPVARARVTPAKERIGLERFEQAWQHAVELFGRNQVSTFVIVGLGEDLSTVIEGSKRVAAMGVYPFVVPLRPIPGSAMTAISPPVPSDLVSIYRSVAADLRKHELTTKASKAGCVRCGACSALPEFENDEE